MTERVAIELDCVSKRYAVGDRHGLLSRRGTRETLWALRDVSLRVMAGESVGLIGHNGAGKTTALRLLAGITRPSDGRVRTNGRVASLINLGAGFHPELTGRENIYLNGVILGLSRREVRASFEAIVEFADLGAYIDTPLKRYSSGMFARLGFAVAAFVDPDVLLVDEVLSVGDVGFQDRSIRKMLSFRDSGQAILFVSHNLSAIEMMCHRTVWLDHGTVRQSGPTAEVVRAYLDAVDEALIDQPGRGPGVLTEGDPSLEAATQDLAIREITFNDVSGQLRSDFDFGDPLRVHVRCLATRALRDVQCTLTVRGDYGPLFEATSESFTTWTAGVHQLECTFDSLPLLPGLYRLDVELTHADGPRWSVPRATGAFRVITDLAEYGSDSVVGATKSRGGFLAVAYDWRMSSSSSSSSASAADEHVLSGLRLPRKISASPTP